MNNEFLDWITEQRAKLIEQLNSGTLTVEQAAGLETALVLIDQMSGAIRFACACGGCCKPKEKGEFNDDFNNDLTT